MRQDRRLRGNRRYKYKTSVNPDHHWSPASLNCLSAQWQIIIYRTALKIGGEEKLNRRTERMRQDRKL